MYKIAGYIAALEIAGLLGFIAVSQTHELTSYRHLSLLIAFVAVAYVAYSGVKRISYKEIVYVAILASAIFVTVVQILGFVFYPGLAKGIAFLSWANATRTAVMLLVGMLGHILLLTVARMAR